MYCSAAEFNYKIEQFQNFYQNLRNVLAKLPACIHNTI